MNTLFYPFYTPSLQDIEKVEFSRSQFIMECGNYGYITVYLCGENLRPKINLGIYMKFTQDEWKNSVVKNEELISIFFNTAGFCIPPVFSQFDGCTLITLKDGQRVLNISTMNNMNGVFIYDQDWKAILKCIECVNMRLKEMNKLRLTFINRINMFKKRLRVHRPTTLMETEALISKLYDKDSPVDCELKNFGIVYLFNTYLLADCEQ